MTSKDKTGDQLLASIRKSKSGTVTGKSAASTAASKPVAGSPQADAPVRAPNSGAATQRQQNTIQSQDNYTVGRRVWPD